MKSISLLNICFAYSGQDNLFDDLSYNFNADARVALIGDNGTGKTTLLKIISGELAPDSGRVVRHASCYLMSQINTQFGKSGGQSQRAALAGAFASGADILLLDEPTNNLDSSGRGEFFRKMRTWHGGMIIVSHDRELLNQMDILLELSNGKISVFGGNYDFYVAQKRQMQHALESKYTDTQKEIGRLNRTLSVAQQTRQHHEHKQQKEIINHVRSRLEGNSLKGKSQETEAKRRNLIQKKLQVQSDLAQQLDAQLRDDKIKVPLKNINIHNQEVIRIENIAFGYGADDFLISDFNLSVRAGDRIRIVGDNGSGKTTLLKLICGDLQPACGNIKTRGKIAYLNQDLSLLDPHESIVTNIMNLSGCLKHDAHAIAANFGFRGASSMRRVCMLSGGELLKATLAAVLGGPDVYDILILDEPTNNLDIKSTLILEYALNSYNGTIILVTHDEMFARKININYTIVI